MEGDGCTGFPNMTWRACCDMHDLAYTLGGSKWQADWDLFLCVAPRDPIAATLMFVAVATAGWLWWLKARRQRP